MNPDDLIIQEHVDPLVRDKEREMFFDLLGKHRLITQNFEDCQKICFEDIRKCLVAGDRDVSTYVTGHLRPDADAIISALFEATRRSFVYPERKCLPFAESMASEVRHILCSDLCSLIEQIQYPKLCNKTLSNGVFRPVPCYPRNMKDRM